MSRRIVVVTAVHEPSAPYLQDAHKSLAAQELPPGWEWHWTIREDGAGESVAPYVPDDSRITFRQGRGGGPGVARTMALAEAHGEFVKVLDADDQLTPGALARDIAVLDANQDVGWTTSRALDLFTDGSTVSFDDPDDGPLARGVILAHWEANGFRAQVHPATLCVRRGLLMALGGWMALPASEDTGLIIALNMVSRGWFIRETGLFYRKWPGQTTAQEAHSNPAELAARTSVIADRARSLANLGWTSAPRR